MVQILLMDLNGAPFRQNCVKSLLEPYVQCIVSMFCEVMVPIAGQAQAAGYWHWHWNHWTDTLVKSYRPGQQPPQHGNKENYFYVKYHLVRTSSQFKLCLDSTKPKRNVTCQHFWMARVRPNTCCRFWMFPAWQLDGVWVDIRDAGNCICILSCLWLLLILTWDQTKEQAMFKVKRSRELLRT